MQAYMSLLAINGKLILVGASPATENFKEIFYSFLYSVKAKSRIMSTVVLMSVLSTFFLEERL